MIEATNPRASRFFDSIIPLALGTIVLAGSVLHYEPSEPLFSRLLTLAGGLGLAIPLLIGGVWVWYREQETVGSQHGVTRLEQNAVAGNVAVWCLAGSALIALLAFLAVANEYAHSLPIADALLFIVWGVGAGGFGGLLTGIYQTQREQELSRRHECEQELNLFRRAVEEVGHSVIITDKDGTVEYVNPAFEQQTGYSKTEIVDRTPGILKSEKQDEEFYEQMWNTILDGEIWQAEITNERKNGELYHVDQTITPILTDGDITHFVGIQYDITDRKLQEQQLSVLNRILRHNVRNAMSVLQINLATLRTEIEGTDLGTDIKTSEERMAELLALIEKTDEARTLIKAGQDPTLTVDPAELVKDVVSDLANTYPHAEITASVDESIGSIRGDTRLKTALREAVDNAIVHNDSTHPTVEISLTENTRIENRVALTVSDYGPGIPEDQRRVFERGEESPLIHATGIGLWIIYWIVASIGGEMQIGDNDPQGTRVTFSLPRALLDETA